MLDLFSNSGLRIQYDTKTNRLIIGDEVIFKNNQTAILDELKPTLLNRILTYPDYIYTEFRKIYEISHIKHFEKHNINHNIIVIPPNLLGIEYVKTHCYTSLPISEKKFACILECIYGVMTVVMQFRVPKVDPAEEAHVTETGIVKAKKGERVVVPTGYDFVIVNTRNQPCVISKFYTKDFRLNYRSIKQEQGLSYYIIRKNARQEVVINPKYKNTPKIKKVKAQILMKKYNILDRKPIYLQILENPIKFKNLLACFEE